MKKILFALIVCVIGLTSCTDGIILTNDYYYHPAPPPYHVTYVMPTPTPHFIGPVLPPGRPMMDHGGHHFSGRR